MGDSQRLGICWDTTASNTGCHQGVATHFDQQQEKACLWLACRHHVGELHIKHADGIRGATKGPTACDLPKNLKKWDVADDNTSPVTWLKHQAKKVLAWGTQHLLAGTFPRENHRELLELIVYYLGDEVIKPRANGPPNIRFAMRQP